MKDPVLNVHFFTTDSGKEPVRDFLRELPAADRKSIGEDIKTVQLGWPLGMPLVRKMEADLWEVRCNIADGIVRVLFTVWEGKMVLVHAFTKKSAKTPQSDLQIARNRLQQIWRGK